MEFEDLVGDLIGNKILAVALAVIVFVILIVGILVTWLYGYMTAVIYAIATLIILFALQKMNLLDAKECPWLILLPFGAFVGGVIVEKGRVFNINLDAFAVRPLTSYANGTQAIISPMFLVAVVIVVCLAVGLIAED